MERYWAYKDSCVEWIGAIPEGWKPERLKYLAFNRVVPAEADTGDYLGLENVQSWTMEICNSDATSIDAAGILYDRGCVLFGKLRPYLAKVALPEGEGPCSSEFLTLIPLGLTREFLAYMLSSELFISEVNSLTYGVRMPRAGWDLIGNMRIPVPPASEQQAIADYLNARTAEIDALVADCEWEVELLREYRKAVISEAVTKGLDPDTSMKDSGVEWIGEIPEHWDAGKLLRHARLESGHTPSRLHPEWWVEEECTIPWVTTQDVHRFRDGLITHIEDTELHVSQIGLDNSSARWLPAGTVALSRTASVGFSIVLSVPMASSQDFADWVPDESLDSYYLLYSLRSMEPVFKQLQMGSTHKTIYMPDIRKLCVAYPPLDEQRAIVTYLDARTAEIDSLVEAKQSMADKLREYRRSLISEVVTGKFKVPGV